MFKKGKRHFRKTLRGRAEDQESGGGASASSSTSTPPVISPPLPKTSKSSAPLADERPFSFPYLHDIPLVPGDTSGSIFLRSGVSGLSSSSGSGELGREGAHKERIQKWIQEQATGFMEKWSGLSSGDPTHAVTRRLKEASAGLDYKSHDCLTALDVSLSRV